MKEITIFKSSFDTPLELQEAPAIKAGFPSPAADYQHISLDFNRDMIRHPEATFYGRVEGDSMTGAGITDGDIVVIDRAVEPQDGDVVVAFLDGEFTVKFLDLSHKSEGYILLCPANDKYEPIRIDNELPFEVWGVVVWTIKNWQHRNVRHR